MGALFFRCDRLGLSKRDDLSYYYWSDSSCIKLPSSLSVVSRGATARVDSFFIMSVLRFHSHQALLIICIFLDVGLLASGSTGKFSQSPLGGKC